MLLTLDAYAQDHEILRLKDGTEITGTIERLPDGGVRITDLNGDIFIFSADEISFATNIEQKEKQAKSAKNRKRTSDSGYTGIIQTGIGYSLAGGIHFTAGLINCYRINPSWYLGIGVDFGTTYYHIYAEQWFTWPIYLHLRYSMLGKRQNNSVSPYIAASAGYDPIDGGDIYFSASLGLHIKKLKHGNLWMGIDLPIHPYLLASYASTLDICFKLGWSF